MNKIGIISYKATKWELFLSKYLPYWIPFISKRKRIKIKWYYKYRYRRRLANAICNTLRNLPPPKWENYKMDFEDYEWEVITNDKHD